MWRHFAISLALLVTVCAARASENYPDVIRSIVATNQPLPCTLCHTLADGGDGAVTTAFGREMLDFGMKGGDPASLRTALRRNAARGWDSDGDGVPDIEELVYGTDPSSPALSSGPPLMHGCTVVRFTPGSPLSTALFAAIAAMLWRRRREK
jgi:hypothetical protein